MLPIPDGLLDPRLGLGVADGDDVTAGQLDLLEFERLPLVAAQLLRLVDHDDVDVAVLESTAHLPNVTTFIVRYDDFFTFAHYPDSRG